MYSYPNVTSSLYWGHITLTFCVWSRLLLFCVGAGLRRSVNHISAARRWNICTKVESFQELTTLLLLQLLCLSGSASVWLFLVHDAFVRTNRDAIAMNPLCSSICPPGTGVHCDYVVHFSSDLSLRSDSPMFWAPWHQSMSTYSQPSFFHFHLMNAN